MNFAIRQLRSAFSFSPHILPHHFALIFAHRPLNAFLIGFPIKLSYGSRCDGLIAHDYAVK